LLHLNRQLINDLIGEIKMKRTTITGTAVSTVALILTSLSVMATDLNMQAGTVTDDVNQCGRVVVVGFSHDEYEKNKGVAKIDAIDGVRKSSRQRVHKLSVGTHKIKLGRLMGVKREAMIEQTITIEPNTSYYLAYEEKPLPDGEINRPFTFSKRFGRSVFIPVIKRTTQQTCEA
jgi:hypothetical protein